MTAKLSGLALFLNSRRLALLGVAIGLVLVGAAAGFVFMTAAATGPSLATARLQGLVLQLSDERLTPARHRAQQELESAGAAAVDPLVTGLHASNPALRRNSAEMLGFIGSPLALDALANSLKSDKDMQVRSRSAWALGELSDLRAVAPLERAAFLDRSLEVRQEALGSLAVLKGNLARSAGLNERDASAFTVSSGNPNRVYLAAAERLYASRDGGKTWRVAGTLPSRIEALGVDPSAADSVLAGTESAGLYSSMDGGATWSSANDSLGISQGTPAAITALYIEKASPGRQYAAVAAWMGGTHRSLLPVGLFESSDGGKSWQRHPSNTPDQPIDRLYVIGSRVYGLIGDQVSILSN